jgi:hypothetical protein
MRESSPERVRPRTSSGCSGERTTPAGWRGASTCAHASCFRVGERVASVWHQVRQQLGHQLPHHPPPHTAKHRRTHLLWRAPQRPLASRAPQAAHQLPEFLQRDREWQRQRARMS